jgi:hypothetical protein
MPEIPNVRFCCGNSNIRDVLKILATEIQTSTARRDRMSPNYAEKRKKHVPKIGYKYTGCKGVHAIEGLDNTGISITSRLYKQCVPK